MQGAYNKIYERLFKSTTFQSIITQTLGLDSNVNLHQFSFATPSDIDSLSIAIFQNDCRQILDLGCGYGSLSLHIAEALPPNATVTGIDLSENAINFAVKQAELKNLTGNVNFFIKDLQTLKLPPKSMDAIFSVDAIQHATDKLACLSNLGEILRPGGILWFTSWFGHALGASSTDILRTDPFFGWLKNCEFLVEEFAIVDPMLVRQRYFYKEVYEQRETLIGEVGPELVEMLLREAIYLFSNTYSRCRVTARRK